MGVLLRGSMSVCPQAHAGQCAGSHTSPVPGESVPPAPRRGGRRWLIPAPADPNTVTSPVNAGPSVQVSDGVHHGTAPVDPGPCLPGPRVEQRLRPAATVTERTASDGP